MKASRIIMSSVFGIFVMGVLMGGCRATPDKVMHRNYMQIKENASTQPDVSALLGSPEHTIGDTWMYTRPDKHLTVIIEFDADGRVVRKQWVDGETGQWEDSKE